MTVGELKKILDTQDDTIQVVIYSGDMIDHIHGICPQNVQIDEIGQQSFLVKGNSPVLLLSGSSILLMK